MVGAEGKILKFRLSRSLEIAISEHVQENTTPLNSAKTLPTIPSSYTSVLQNTKLHLTWAKIYDPRAGLPMCGAVVTSFPNGPPIT